MKRIALFVEGQTEQIFAGKLLCEFIGKRRLCIRNLDSSILKNCTENPILFTAQDIDMDTEYYFEIYDCGGDNKVQSTIRDNFDSLRKASFSFVIGIRDVHPNSDLDKLRAMVDAYLPNNPVLPVRIIFAVREVEAWFLAEETHYHRIHKLLSFEVANKIAGKEIAGIDVSKDSTETIWHPADTLKRIYMKGKTTYNKHEGKVQRTVDALNYENLYINVRRRNNSLNELLTCLERLIP